MKVFCVALGAVVLLTGCKEQKKDGEKAPEVSAMKDYPTIAVDLAHHQTERKDGTEPPSYPISPSGGMILDTGSYQPKLDPKSGEKECNSVQLIIGNDRQYSAEFDPSKTRHVLDSATLKANPGSKPFAGIQAGDSCIIAIGHMSHEPGKPANFSVAWVSLAKAAAKP